MMETSAENYNSFNKRNTLAVFVPCAGHSFGKLTPTFFKIILRNHSRPSLKKAGAKRYTNN